MTFKREISWVLLIKLIAITAIWYIWFSGPRQQIDPAHLFVSSPAIEQSTPSISNESEVNK